MNRSTQGTQGFLGLLHGNVTASQICIVSRGHTQRAVHKDLDLQVFFFEAA
jgi:hypothetical protein